MKKLFLLLLFVAAVPAHAQTIGYSVQLNGLVRVAGSFDNQYYFCTVIDQAAATISVTTPRTVGGTSGRAGHAPPIYTATISSIDVVGVEGNTTPTIPVGTSAGTYAPVLSKGCYALIIQGNGTGTNNQGVVQLEVIVPYYIAPVAPSPSNRDES